MENDAEVLLKAFRAMKTAGHWTARTARLMVGVPHYETYVEHRKANHPDQPIMTYEEFFRERQNARYTFDSNRLRGCC
jgi:uncharacterized short protein YbdD (DUF466 family)